MGKSYEKEDKDLTSGIDIEKAKNVMRAEDKFDRKKEKERIKELHKEKKRKEKELKNKRRKEAEEANEDGDEEEVRSTQNCPVL